MGTASGFGFVSGERGVANEAVRSLSAGPWAFFDLREVEPARVEALLIDGLASGPRQLLLVIHRVFPSVLGRVIKGYVDRLPELLFGARRVARPAGGSLVVVVDGADNLVGLPEPLPTVAYWDFLP